jgi:hypothetical protein
MSTMRAMQRRCCDGRDAVHPPKLAGERTAFSQGLEVKNRNLSYYVYGKKRQQGLQIASFHHPRARPGW